MLDSAAHWFLFLASTAPSVRSSVNTISETPEAGIKPQKQPPEWTKIHSVGGTPRGSCNRTLLRRVLRRRLVRVSIETEVLRRVLRRGGVIEGA